MAISTVYGTSGQRQGEGNGDARHCWEVGEGTQIAPGQSCSKNETETQRLALPVFRSSIQLAYSVI